MLTFAIQADMCLVQGAFFGQYLLYPEHYGGKHATYEDVSNFLKLWRANGYYLGISDEYNAVMETFEETKIFGQLTLEKLLKPCMLHLSPEAIHMAKVNFNYEFKKNGFNKLFRLLCFLLWIIM